MSKITKWALEMPTDYAAVSNYSDSVVQFFDAKEEALNFLVQLDPIPNSYLGDFYLVELNYDPENFEIYVEYTADSLDPRVFLKRIYKEEYKITRTSILAEYTIVDQLRDKHRLEELLREKDYLMGKLEQVDTELDKLERD